MGGVIPFLFIAFVVFIIYIQSKRARTLIAQLAADNDYQLLDARFSFSKGPYFWTSSKEQWIYRVTVQDEQGDVHSGWLRVGSWFWGLWSNKTDVRWDNE